MTSFTVFLVSLLTFYQLLHDTKYVNEITKANNHHNGNATVLQKMTTTANTTTNTTTNTALANITISFNNDTGIAKKETHFHFNDSVEVREEAASLQSPKTIAIITVNTDNTTADHGDTSINNVAFLHIPKTGGTTIEKWGAQYHNSKWGYCYFHPNTKNQCTSETTDDRTSRKKDKKKNKFAFNYKDLAAKSTVPWHIPIQYLPSKLYKDIYYNKTTFAVIRNPFSRTISEYYYRCATYPKQKQCTPKGSFEDHTYRVNQWLNKTLWNFQQCSTKYHQNIYHHRPSSLTKFPLPLPPKCYFESGGHFIPQYEYIYSDYTYYEADDKHQRDDQKNSTVTSPSPISTRRRRKTKMVQVVFKFESFFENDFFWNYFNLSKRVPTPSKSIRNNGSGDASGNKKVRKETKWGRTVQEMDLTDSNRDLIRSIYKKDFELGSWDPFEFG